VGAIQALLTMAYQRLQEKRYDSALKAYEDVLALDRLNQNAKRRKASWSRASTGSGTCSRS
jgi:hypothetical protein